MLNSSCRATDTVSACCRRPAAGPTQTITCSSSSSSRQHQQHQQQQQQRRQQRRAGPPLSSVHTAACPCPALGEAPRRLDSIMDAEGVEDMLGWQQQDLLVIREQMAESAPEEQQPQQLQLLRAMEWQERQTEAENEGEDVPLVAEGATSAKRGRAGRPADPIFAEHYTKVLHMWPHI
jgi:hypothetical protein